MLQEKLRRLRSKKGFTLVELIVVVAIIAVLAAILVPLMGNYLHDSRVSTATAGATTIRNIANGAMAKATANGRDRKQINTVQIIGVDIISGAPAVYTVAGGAATAIIPTTSNADWNANGTGIVTFAEEIREQLIGSGASDGAGVIGIWGNRVMGSAFTQSVDTVTPGATVGQLSTLLESGPGTSLADMTPLASGALPGAFLPAAIDDRNVVIAPGSPMEGSVVGYA
ncbi:MAG: prepilin-type N-terminal cleavage/methylation domain-containing protein [Oscillospiraceae bacterium]|nr:prepilin-type N-terminal cleavage/methylation domain-containing protein [Oscillospiraceae bacterium]